MSRRSFHVFLPDEAYTAVADVAGEHGVSMSSLVVWFASNIETLVGDHPELIAAARAHDRAGRRRGRSRRAS